MKLLLKTLQYSATHAYKFLFVTERCDIVITFIINKYPLNKYL